MEMDPVDDPGGAGTAVGGSCGSCGEQHDDLVAVHRLYVTPESWDTPGEVQRLDEVEWWCFPCRTHYPHEAVRATH